MPKGAQLDGFDLSGDQFPHKSTWPANVKFSTLDAFGEVPEGFIHKYDVVHLRFWCCVVRNNDPSGLIRHAERLLSMHIQFYCHAEIFTNELALIEPGGYIQWEDANLGKAVIHGHVAEEFGRIMRLLFVAAKFDFK